MVSPAAARILGDFRARRLPSFLWFLLLLLVFCETFVNIGFPFPLIYLAFSLVFSLVFLLVFSWNKAKVAGGDTPFSLRGFHHSHDWLCTSRTKNTLGLLLRRSVAFPFRCGFKSRSSAARKLKTAKKEQRGGVIRANRHRATEK